MASSVADLWRYPLKGHSRERISGTVLTKGATMPGDREWAVLFENGRFDPLDPAWKPSVNFARGSKNPAIMAIDARYDDENRRLTLTHPDLPEFDFCPDLAVDKTRFLDWVRPLNVPGKPLPVDVVRVPGRGMTDTDFPSISLLFTGSSGALSDAAGQTISRLRWRGNIWITGTKAWEEFDWIGQTIAIGKARLLVREPIVRCLATTANPATGTRDLDTLALLKQDRGHTNFGIYAEVVNGGPIEIGDPVAFGPV